MFIRYNPNPMANRVGDCTVRAICKLTGQKWEDVYCDLAIYGMMRCDMPSANAVWGAYLKDKGYKRTAISDDCPDCYTVEDFEKEHPKGKYLLAISGHTVAVEDGNSYGRHWVRGHYSRDDSRESLRNNMDRMMSNENLSSEQRMALERAMNVL